MLTIPWQKRRKYRAAILLGGDFHQTLESKELLASCDSLAAADSGAAYARAIGRVPDLAVGDFDSITDEDMDWLSQNEVLTYRYAAGKDETDAELAAFLLLAMQVRTKSESSRDYFENSNLSLIADQSWNNAIIRDDLELLLLGATGSRPDHMLANIALSRKLTEKGIPVLLSDGISLFVPLCGASEARVLWPREPQNTVDWLFSALAMSDSVTDLSYQDVQFPVDNITIHRGTSLGLSNRCLDPKVVDFSFSLAEGSLLLIVTPED